MVKRVQVCHDCSKRFITSDQSLRICNECIEDQPLSSFTERKSDDKIASCSVCGASLSHIQTWEGRLQHSKRCSRKFGVQAQDLCYNDEEEMFEEDENIEPQKAPAATLHSILMKGAQQAARKEKIEKIIQPEKKRSRGGNWGQSARNYCPQYKRIPGTDFVVDAFQYIQQARTTNFFLSHFHADHYGGLTKKFDAGIIYCSRPTAALVEQQLGVDSKYLKPLPMNQRIKLSAKTTVILLDANHCPGAVMFLFETGNKTVLHVGDFRWHHAKMVPALKPYLSKPVDELYLDTTYCDPKKVLPTQEDAIDATIELVKREYKKAQANGYQLLLLFGAYTIGKERIYISVSKALGLKICVDRRRYRILSALDFDSETMSLFTTNQSETNLWVVPLAHINMKKLPEYMTFKSRSFSRILGVRPTGWAMKSKASGILNTSVKGSIMICGVPYSEHSSFPELVDCLETLLPRKIVPTVSVSKSEQQIQTLMSHMKVKI